MDCAGLSRFVLVLPSNPFDDSRIATAVVAAVTSNLALVAAPGNVGLGKAESGLRSDRPSTCRASSRSIVRCSRRGSGTSARP
jgi:mRNA interferase MazF